MVVLHKDVDTLVDGAVLNDGVVSLLNGQQVAKTLFEEVDLEVERPPIDVLVVVLQVRVLLNSLEAWLPAIVAGQHLRQRGLSATNVSCYCDVHIPKRL